MGKTVRIAVRMGRLRVGGRPTEFGPLVYGQPGTGLSAVKIYSYWAESSEQVSAGERTWKVRCYGASNASVEDALRDARRRAQQAAAAIRRGGPRRRYPYGERLLREETIERFEADGRTRAILTRNSYGSVILNTSGALFADIDYQSPRGALASLRDAVARLFGRPRADQDQQIVSRVSEIVGTRADLGLRLYRTLNGFRCLVTSGTFDPQEDSAGRLLEELDSDPLYRTMCRVQGCFRARVSPKPWRCGCPPPPSRFPWTDAAEEEAYRSWQRDYEQRADAFSTCVFIGAFGAQPVDSAVEPLVAIHDSLACRGDGPLA